MCANDDGVAHWAIDSGWHTVNVDESWTRPVVRRVRSAVAVVALLLTLVGCSSGDAKGTIAGKLHYEGGIAEPANGGVIHGKVTAVRADGKTFTTGVPDSGMFTLSVPSGDYKVTGTSPLYQDGDLPCPVNNSGGRAVTVRSGETATTDLPCQIM